MEKKIGKTRHRKYDAQFKEEALKQIENGQRVSSVAQALGISEALLYQWRQRGGTISQLGNSSEVEVLRKQVKQLETEHFKKSLDHFQPLAMCEMYQFISAQGKNYPVLQLCNVLGATRSSYYAYRNGKTYATSPVEQAEVKQVCKLFSLHRRRYGSRRVAKALQQKGVETGRFKVRRLTGDQSLRAIQPKSFVPKTTNSKHKLGYAPNVLAEVGFPSGPDDVYVGDITYLPTTYGQWLYLNVWIDLFSGSVVDGK